MSKYGCFYLWGITQVICEIFDFIMCLFLQLECILICIKFHSYEDLFLKILRIILVKAVYEYIITKKSYFIFKMKYVSRSDIAIHKSYVNSRTYFFLTFISNLNCLNLNCSINNLSKFLDYQIVHPWQYVTIILTLNMF